MTPDNVILTCLKVAEEYGIIIRLWECAGCDTAAIVDVSGLGSIQEARLTDLLERDEKNLTITDGHVIISNDEESLERKR